MMPRVSGLRRTNASRNRGSGRIRGLRGLVALVPPLLLLAGPLSAHVVRSPRVVHLRVLGERVELAIGVQIHEGPDAARYRQRFDRNGDLQLDAEEQSLLADWLDGDARRNLRVAVDGVALAPETGERNLRLRKDDGTAAGDGIELRSVAAVALAIRPGLHRVQIEDVPENPRNIVALRIDLAEGIALSDCRVQGQAAPPVAAAGGKAGWDAGFSGGGGSIDCAIEVPPRGAAPTR
jgi:hypothetical protein